jgi:hypothetical protein
MQFNIRVSTLLAALAVSQATASLNWLMVGNQYAASSFNQTGELTLQPGTSTPSARFYYQKTATSGPLVNVSLIVGGEAKEVAWLLRDFSYINQECSCYWLDAVDLFKNIPQLPDSSQYRIQFRSADGTLTSRSGYFGLKRGAIINSSSSSSSVSRSTNTPTPSSLTTTTTTTTMKSQDQKQPKTPAPSSTSQSTTVTPPLVTPQSKSSATTPSHTPISTPTINETEFSSSNNEATDNMIDFNPVINGTLPMPTDTSNGTDNAVRTDFGSGTSDDGAPTSSAVKQSAIEFGPLIATLLFVGINAFLNF